MKLILLDNKWGKWIAKFDVPGAKDAKKVIIENGNLSREEALEYLKTHAVEISPNEPLVLSGDMVVEPEPSRWDRFKYWLVYG